MSEQLQFVFLAAPSPYNIAQDEDVEVARCRLTVASVQVPLYSPFLLVLFCLAVLNV